MANIDLRNWISAIIAAGELKVITGAEPRQEIGGIVDIYQRRMGNPAVMFDGIPGFPRGHRVLANILTSVKRINIALGLPPQGSEMELIRWWRNYMRDTPTFPPKRVNGGPLLENVSEGNDVDIGRIPTPVWHEQDGGPYIGTACMVVMKDPDSGWINYGAYRVQSQGPAVATVMMSPGKHGRIIMGKYHARNEPCPVAVVAGMHPALFMLAGLEIPYGKSEFEAAGGILGEPVEVFDMPRTGLPVPANAEIAFEGHIHPGDMLQEGPLGEWTGYYAGGTAPNRRSASPPSCTAMTRSWSARFPRCRPTTTPSISAPTVAARCGTSSKPPGCRRSKGCGPTRPAAAGSGSRCRSSSFTAAMPSRPASSPRNATPAPIPTAGPSWSTMTSIPLTSTT